MEVFLNTPNNAKHALDLALHWEANAPERTYLTQPLGGDEVRSYTWGETMDEARRMASYLKSLNYPQGSHIALLSKNCANWIMCDLAIWMAGYVSVPLYPTLTSDTVSYILEHSEAKMIFIGKLDDWDMMREGVPKDMPAVAFGLAPQEVREGNLLWDEVVAKHQPLTDIAQPEREDLATIVYTSGSTGHPKGVMISFGAMKDAAAGITKELEIHPQDRILSYLPLSHVFERYIVQMGSIHSGFQVFFADSLDTFLADLNRARPTLFMSIPRIWTKFQSGIFAKMPKQKLDRMFRIPLLSGFIKKKILKTLGLEHVRYAGSGSAPLSADTIGWYRSLGLELLEGYGMSENFAYSHASKPGRSRLGYVGEALDGVECKISEQGEILIKSPGLMLGYYKEPEKTKETFSEDGFLKTGDRGEIDELGRLKITGRTKELFKTSKGKYVAPAPIENKVVNHPDVEVVCVSGSGCPQPHALLLLSDDAWPKRDDASFRETFTRETEALLAEVNETLDPHERLDFAVVVAQPWTIENGFLTPTMKLKRDVVESAYVDKLDGWYGARKKVIFE